MHHELSMPASADGRWLRRGAYAYSRDERHRQQRPQKRGSKEPQITEGCSHSDSPDRAPQAVLTSRGARSSAASGTDRLASHRVEPNPFRSKEHTTTRASSPEWHVGHCPRFALRHSDPRSWTGGSLANLAVDSPWHEGMDRPIDNAPLQLGKVTHVAEARAARGANAHTMPCPLSC